MCVRTSTCSFPSLHWLNSQVYPLKHNRGFHSHLATDFSMHVRKQQGSNSTLAHSVSVSKGVCVFHILCKQYKLKYTVALLSLCVYLSGSGLSTQGQVGGDKTPLQCGVVVNWFGSGLNLLTDTSSFPPQDQKDETAFTQASHNTFNSVCEPVLGQNAGVNL